MTTQKLIAKFSKDLPSFYRYVLAYLGIEIGFLAWRLLQPLLNNRIAEVMAVILLIGVVGWLQYLLLFRSKNREQRRALLINLTLLAFSLTIMFVSFCYGYALIINRRGYYDRHRLFFDYFQAHPDLGYMARPDLTDLPLASSLGNVGTVLHSTDEFGFRADKSGHYTPIAVVGDSFGFGAWMPAKNSWSEKLEEELNIPVTNYSAPGYSLWQYNQLIETYVSRFQNQLVIYSIFTNDLKDDHLEEQHKNDYYSYIGWRKFRDPITYTITDLGLTIDSPLSIIFNTVRKKIEDLTRLASYRLENGLVLFKGYTGLTSDYFHDGSEQVVFERLTRAQEIASKNGVELVVIIFPSKESTYKDEFIKVFDGGEKDIQTEEMAYARLCDFLQKKEVLCYDLTEALRRQAIDSRPLYFSIDSHLNKHGNATAARLIASYLEAKNLTSEW